MSWQEVESHIRSMVENGNYMSANEIFLVESVERERVPMTFRTFFVTISGKCQKVLS